MKKLSLLFCLLILSLLFACKQEASNNASNGETVETTTEKTEKVKTPEETNEEFKKKLKKNKPLTTNDFQELEKVYPPIFDKLSLPKLPDAIINVVRKRETGKFNQYTIFMESSKSVEAVNNFYKQKMKGLKWDLRKENNVAERNISNLSFNKKSNLVNINVLPKGDSNTVVNLSVLERVTSE